MPTENRSSNTENAPCPFCGGQVDPEGWLRGDGMRGPECESCGATAPNLALWNGAQPAQQHQGEPVALPKRKMHHLDPSFLSESDKGWNACLDEIAKLGPLYTHADPAEVERQRSRADTNALNHKHAKNALGDIKAFVGRLVAASAGQDSVATGYLSDIADFIDRRTIGDPVHIGDSNALRLDLQESRRNEFNASAELERLREELDLIKISFDSNFDAAQQARTERDTQRAQLAEAQALLREAACHATRMEPMSASCLNRIDTALDRKG